MIKRNPPEEAYKVGAILTLPATGSEWNKNFVISRRDIGWKLGNDFNITYPYFSLMDPRYTMTLPIKQIQNGIFDAFTHCVDQFLTPVESPMFDHFWMSVMKELVDIAPDVLKPNSSLELHERLIVACSFALNYIFSLSKKTYFEIHKFGHQLTAYYGIDHGASLAMVMPAFLESQIEERKNIYSQCAEFVFGEKNGTIEQKAQAFIDHIRKFIDEIKIAKSVSQWEGVTIGENDVDKVTNCIMEQSSGGKPFGFNNCCTKELVHQVIEKVIV